MYRLLLAVAVGFSFSAAAQQPAPPPLPPGPILARMPNYSKWQVSYSYTEDKAPAGQGGGAAIASSSSVSDQPRKVTVTRTQPLWSAITIDKSGRETQQWFDGKNHFLKLPDNGEPGLMPLDNLGANFPYLLDYTKADFPEVTWLSPDNYVGVQKVGGSNCYVFRQSSGYQGAIAWVDSETHFLVRWQRGEEIRTIRILETPSQPIALPKNIGELKQRLQLINKINTITDPPPRAKNAFHPKAE